MLRAAQVRLDAGCREGRRVEVVGNLPAPEHGDHEPRVVRVERVDLRRRGRQEAPPLEGGRGPGHRVSIGDAQDPAAERGVGDDGTCRTQCGRGRPLSKRGIVDRVRIRQHCVARTRAAGARGSARAARSSSAARAARPSSAARAARPSSAARAARSGGSACTGGSARAGGAAAIRRAVSATAPAQNQQAEGDHHRSSEHHIQPSRGWMRSSSNDRASTRRPAKSRSQDIVQRPVSHSMGLARHAGSRARAAGCAGGAVSAPTAPSGSSGRSRCSSRAERRCRRCPAARPSCRR